MTKASDFAAQYLDLVTPGRRTGGRSGNSEERGRRNVAFELTLHAKTQYEWHRPNRRFMVTNLFTFWPPGPEDLLKDTSHIPRGIVSVSNLPSHFLAASSSPSSMLASFWRDVKARDRSAVLGVCCRTFENAVVNCATLLIMLLYKNNNEVSQNCGEPSNHLEEIIVIT